MKHSKRFNYFQPNEKDLKDKYGDCQVRALAKALEKTWLEIFDLTIPICRSFQTYGIFDLPIAERKEALSMLGFDYHGVSIAHHKKRPTIDQFAKEHPQGRYVCNVAHHVVAVVDGQYFDTWDSGWCKMYGYFEKRKEAGNEEV